MEKTFTIYSFTQIFVAAEQFQERVPYYSAIIEGDDGKRRPSFIIDVKEDDAVKIGEKVRFDSYDENGQMQCVLCR
jgi:uncharacterized OB-fold protein